ncbi:unnamed protein product, partial [Amoebophrya sp. A25]|eukprot:GSA25T00007108001.1
MSRILLNNTYPQDHADVLAAHRVWATSMQSRTSSSSSPAGGGGGSCGGSFPVRVTYSSALWRHRGFGSGSVKAGTSSRQKRVKSSSSGARAFNVGQQDTLEHALLVQQAGRGRPGESNTKNIDPTTRTTVIMTSSTAEVDSSVHPNSSSTQIASSKNASTSSKGSSNVALPFVDEHEHDYKTGVVDHPPVPVVQEDHQKLQEDHMDDYARLLHLLQTTPIAVGEVDSTTSCTTKNDTRNMLPTSSRFHTQEEQVAAEDVQDVVERTEEP